MTEDKIKRVPKQRSHVNIYEEWDVTYWLKELACTRQQLEKAVTEVGTSADKVSDYIRKQNIHL